LIHRSKILGCKYFALQRGAPGNDREPLKMGVGPTLIMHVMHMIGAIGGDGVSPSWPGFFNKLDWGGLN
jgi:hypothetical protein